MRVQLLALTAAAFTALAAPASAAVTTVDYDFVTADGGSAGNGSFSFDSALTGLLTYEDLDSFSITIGGGSYDLAYVLSGNFSVYRYFGFNATTELFETADLGGFPQILSAIKDDFSSGFFVRDDSIKLARNYNPESGELPFVRVAINSSTGGVVPEPATWAMMIAGFGLVGAVSRRRRATTVTA
jgi:hypothetical protein